jgi:hypothetical protein
VLKVSRLFKQLPVIRSVLEEVMVKLYFSMLTRISVNLSCNASSTEVSKASVLVQTVSKCLQLPAKDSFTD